MIEDHKYESKIIKVDSYPLQNIDDFSVKFHRMF